MVSRWERLSHFLQTVTQVITGQPRRIRVQPVEGQVRGGREEGVRRDFAQKGGRKELGQQPQVEMEREGSG